MVWQCVANREPRAHSWPALAAAACLDQFETELHPSFIMSTSTRHVYGLLIQWPQSSLLTFHKSSLRLLPSMLIPPLSYHISLPLPHSSFSTLSLSHSPPTLRLTKCCGASTAGCLQICYITGPSASLNHCWARLASAWLHISLAYHYLMPRSKVSVS